MLTGFWFEAAGATLLVVALGYASAKDLRTREVSDAVWLVFGLAGALLGGLGVASGGTVPTLVWVVVAALALEHLFPWDDALGERHAPKVPALELGAYAVGVVVVGYAGFRWGVGPNGVPLAAVALLVTIVLARGLFELGVLYGGADAKALIVAGLLVPLFATPLLYAPGTSTVALAVLPFSVTLLTDAALLSLAVPIGIGVRNLARGEFSLARGFTTYTLPVEELPRRFVWVRDPALGQDTLSDDADTSEEDTRRRTEIAASLRARGVTRVWVSPQLPFLVLMTAGAIAGLLAGNLILDLLVLR